MPIFVRKPLAVLFLFFFFRDNLFSLFVNYNFTSSQIDAEVEFAHRYSRTGTDSANPPPLQNELLH